jgi:hypothetical protein
MHEALGFGGLNCRHEQQLSKHAPIQDRSAPDDQFAPGGGDTNLYLDARNENWNGQCWVGAFLHH